MHSERKRAIDAPTAALSAAAFLIPIAFIGPAENPFGPIKTFLAILFACVALAGAVARFAKVGELPVLAWPEKVFLPLGAWAALSVLWSLSRSAAAWELVKMLTGFALFSASARAACDSRKRMAVLSAVVAGGLIVSIYGLAQYYGADFYKWDIESVRISSSLGNPAYLTGYLLLIIPAAAGAAGLMRAGWRKAIFSATAGLSLICLIYTQTRIGWASFAIATAVFAFCSIGNRSLRAGLFANKGKVAAIALILAAILYVFSTDNFLNKQEIYIWPKMKTAFKKIDDSWAQRKVIWMTAERMFADHPVLGVGLGGYRHNHAIYQKFALRDPAARDWISFPFEAHNDLLQIACELGTPGAALTLAFVFGLIGAALKSTLLEKSAQQAGLKAALLSAIVGLSLFSIFQFPLRIEGCAFIAWILAGILFGSGAGPDLLEKRKVEAMGAGARRAAAFLSFGIFAALVALAGVRTVANWGFYAVRAGSERRNLDQAIEKLKMWSKIDPYSYEIQLKYGHYLSRAGRPDEAVVPFQRANILYPNDGLAMYELGKAHLDSGRTELAVEWLERSCELNPKYKMAWLALGIAYYKKENYNGTLNAFGQAAAIDSNDSDVWYNAGLTLKKLGKMESAADSFRKALQLKPGFSEAQYGLGSALLMGGRIEEAKEVFAGLLESEPDHLNAMGSLGVAYLELGDYRGAAELLKRVLEQAPANLPACMNLAQAELLLKNKEEICEIYKPCREAYPDNRELQSALEKVGCMFNANP